MLFVTVLVEIDYKEGFNNSLIGECCAGTRKTHKGRVWRFLNDDQKTNDRINMQAERKNELFSSMIDSLKLKLEEKGITEADNIAFSTVFDIYEDWRGLSVVFPMNPEKYMERMKDKIIAEFNGKNLTHLVRKYKYSENIIYRWIRESRSEINEKIAARVREADAKVGMA